MTMKSVKVTAWGDKVKADTLLREYYSTNVSVVKATLKKSEWTSPPMLDANATAFRDGIMAIGGSASFVP